MEGDLPEGWTLVRHILPGGRLGETCWSTQTVTIDPSYPEVTQRCTLVHESFHVERGPVLDEPALAAREEMAVQKATARQMVDVRDLGEALAESDDLAHVAEVLDVDVDVLTTRLRHLHPAERAYLRRRLEHDDHREPEPEEPAGCGFESGLACAECQCRA